MTPIFVSALFASPAGDALKCTAPVASVEALFHTQLATFAHAASGRTNVIRHWGALSVPAALKADIEFVSGLGVFVAQPTRKAARAGMAVT